MTVAGYFIGFLAGWIALAMIKSLNQPIGVEILFATTATLIGLLGVTVLKKITEVTE